MRHRRFILWLAALALGGGLAFGDPPYEVLETPRPSPSPAKRPLAPHEVPLAAIQEEGRLEVRRLAESLSGVTDPERRRRIGREIVETKKTYRLKFLEALAHGAGERGEVEVQAEALRQISILRDPPKPKPKPDPVSRPAPRKPAPGGGERP